MAPADTLDSAAREHEADPRYLRLIEATRAAARRGYDAVSMRELAEKCRLSMTTIYHFCRSKDQLIAEAHLDRMGELRAALAARPVKGETAEERVRQVMHSLTRALEIDARLSRTLMRAMYSLDPAVTDVRLSVGASFATIIESAIGDQELSNLDDRAARIVALGHVFNSVIVGWLSERHDHDWVNRELDSAVRVIFGAR